MKAKNIQEQITEFIKENNWLNTEIDTQRELTNIDIFIECLCKGCLQCILGGYFQVQDSIKTVPTMFVVKIADELTVYMHKNSISVNANYSFNIPIAYKSKYNAIYNKLTEIYKNNSNE